MLSACLNAASKLEVETSAEFFWEVADPLSTKAKLLMTSAELQNLDDADKEQLTAEDAWMPTAAGDFLGEPSVYTTVALLDTFEGSNSGLASGKVY